MSKGQLKSMLQKEHKENWKNELEAVLLFFSRVTGPSFEHHPAANFKQLFSNYHSLFTSSHPRRNRRSLPPLVCSSWTAVVRLKYKIIIVLWRVGFTLVIARLTGYYVSSSFGVRLDGDRLADRFSWLDYGFVVKFIAVRLKFSIVVGLIGWLMRSCWTV